MQKFKVYFWNRIPKSYFKEIKEKYKNRKNDYMNVYVCEDREEMYNLTDKLENSKIERDYAGRTWCYNKNWYEEENGERKYIKTSPLCGHIVFCKEYFYQDAVAHETTRAVIGYFNRKLKDCQNIFTKVDEYGNILDEEVAPEEDLEELFCYMVGNISDQICCKYRKSVEKGGE